MASVNKIILIGNVGRVDVKTFQDGGKVVELSLATSERYTDRNGTQREDTQWHRLLLGGKLADVAEKYVTKGTPLYAEGKMRYRQYTNRDGETKEAAEVQVQAIQLLGKREAQQGAAAQAPQPGNPYLASLMEDDLP